MKRFILLALCALFTCQAGARTLYVDARRPNNKGNGLSVRKAKKTLQAAVNIARDGDTIIVLKGKYSTPLKTKNKRIKIKAKSGAGATFAAAKKWLEAYSLDLGNGTATKVTGFTVMRHYYRRDDYGYYVPAGGVRGGTLSKCTLLSLGSIFGKPTVSYSKLSDCLLSNCCPDTQGRKFISHATLNRCKIVDAEARGGKKYAPIASSKLCNCLVADSDGVSFSLCTLGNCTVADNDRVALKGNKGYNTIFNGVSAAQFKKTKKNTFKNCYTGTNPGFVDSDDTDDDDDDDDDDYTDDADEDYHLQAGSPCIDKGTKSTAAKKLYGKKDLDGKKRVKGRSVDIGCYEY